MALELILRSLLNSKKFASSSSEEKDWQTISKLVPGATPKQCAKKWEELIQENRPLKSNEDFEDVGLSAVVNYLLVSKDSEESSEEEQDTHDSENNETVDQTNCKKEQEYNCKPNKSEDLPEQKKDPLLSGTKKLKPKPITPDGPNMVIHVCDESKNLKQDFSCPRDLLVKEMKYFAEYLSLEPQRWEEVDISVHCDVQIFDWLMHYAKRDTCMTSSDDAVPRLEANNVISILISSDFLRMDSLVTKCIHYCHDNMSTILATPCNMNCINDKLVTRIAKLFNDTELDAIKDRKDKFKSKLFCKKIEQLVDVSPSLGSCPDNASTLFRCSSCKRLLTANNQSKVPCVLNRMNIDSRGKTSYGHIRDVTWDINDYLLELKEKLKSWRDVYWRLWGSVVTLYCSHCHYYFPGTELGHCRYHTQSAEYTEGCESHVVGIYPCCQEKCLRYDAIGVLSGCHVKDHVIKLLNSSKVEKETNKNDQNEGSESSEDDIESPQTDHENGNENGPDNFKSSVINDPSIVKELLTHSDVICLPFQMVARARTSELNVFQDDELIGNSKISGGYSKKLSANNSISERKVVNDAAALPPIRRSKTGISQRMPSSRRKTAILKRDYSTSSEDEEEDDVQHNYKVPTRHFQRAKKKHSSENRQSSGFKWDPHRSQRWNQDAQREEDSKRMTEVINAMAKLRSANQEKKQKGKEFPGGIFHKLEHQFRISSQPPSIKHQSSHNQLTTGSRSRRAVAKS